MNSFFFFFNFCFFSSAIEKLERILTGTVIAESTTLSANGSIALMYKLNGSFKGLRINADEHSVR